MKPYAAPFVPSDVAPLTGAIVVRPSTAVDRLIPLKSEPGTIAERAREQHAILVRTLTDHGVAVEQLEPANESPTESFVADLAIVIPQGAILARPAHVERRAEVVRIEERLRAAGIPIVGRIEAPGLLDGSDVALAADRVFVGAARAGGGLVPRSNAFGRAQLEAIVAEYGLRTVELALAPDALRLRNVFTVIAADTVVAAPDKVDLVAAAGMRVIEIPRGEDFAAALLPLGERRVIGSLRFRESIALLRRAKISVESIDLHEFGKAGYGAPSLVLAVKRG